MPPEAQPGPPPAPPFEIGFVLAGAVSAGCYSAGVMDFIIEALDDYYVERDKPGWTGPRHDVRVPVLAGASAGGMTAGMAALHMFRNMAHVWPGDDVPPKAQNRLYSSWVTDISIERLLETTDLDGNSTGLRSALCGTVLDEILANAFLINDPVIQRPWIGRSGDPTLRVVLTMTNLRGVPYSFELIGGEPAVDAFSMMNHADIGAFRIGIGASPEDQPWLDVTKTTAPDWALFKVAALATGAFPVGLPPRPVKRPADNFKTGGTVGYVDEKGNFQPIAPDKRFPLGVPFEYWAVDGGTIDNEPLELARRILTGGGKDQANGIDADKAVILVAPFPNFHSLKPDTVDGTLKSVLPSLFSGLIDQARFKPEELAKARDGSDFSRYLISPMRMKSDGTAPEFAIASGTLGGFSGFLHESFRRHDYLLGRRNAQAFLRWNFGLPKSHPIFGGKSFAPEWIVRDAGLATKTIEPGQDLNLNAKAFKIRKGDGATECGYPIIPLTPKMQRPIRIGDADRPRPSSDMLEPIKPLLRERIKRSVDVLVDIDFVDATKGFGPTAALVRFGAKHYGTEVIHTKLVEFIGPALDELGKSFP